MLADPDKSSDDRGEWIELHNFGDAPAQLQGWVLVSNNDAPHTIGASLTVPAGGYVVLAKDGNSKRNGGITPDYVLLSKKDEILGQPYNYRDARTQGMMAHAFTKAPRSEIFANTGVQFMEINTLYQLLSMQLGDPELLAQAHRFLMMPDFFHWLLCGSRVVEFTNRISGGQNYRTFREVYGIDLVKLFVKSVAGLPFDEVVRGTEVQLPVPRFSACATCEAHGRTTAGVCEGCGGRGVRRVVDLVKVGIPAGVDSGTQVRVADEGHAAPFGGPRGDLIVSTRVREHPFFVRKGDAVHCEVPITVWEALRGARVHVPTPQGQAVLVVPPGTREVFHGEWEYEGRDDDHIDFVTDDLARFVDEIADAIAA